MNALTNELSNSYENMNASQLLRSAKSAEKLGNYILAIDLYTFITKRFPGNLEARKRITELKDVNPIPDLAPLIEEKRFSEVENILVSNIDRDHKNPHFWKLLGITYKEQAKHSLSLQCYEKALELQPNDIDLIHQIGCDLLALNDVKNAFKTFKYLLSMDPSVSSAHTNLGIIYNKVNDLGNAKNEWREALKLNSTDTLAITHLGITATTEGYYEAALEYFSQCIEIDTNDITNLMNVACVYFEIGEIEKAMQLYEEWERRDWGNASEDLKNSFKLNYGLALFSAGQVEKAWEMFSARTYVSGNHLMNPNDESFPLLKNIEQAEGKRILLAMEQGVGDQLFFLGLLKEFKKITKCAIILQTENRLKDLLTASFPDCEIVTDLDLDKINADFWLLYGDMGKLLKYDKDKSELCQPYLLSNTTAKYSWRKQLDKKKPNVGIIWRSGLINPRRLVNYTLLKDWIEIINNDEINTICLQYSDITEDLKELDTETRQRLIIPAFDLKDDFGSMSALLNDCDLVFGPSTAPTIQSMVQGKNTITYELKALDRWSFGLCCTENEYRNIWYQNARTLIFEQSKKHLLVQRMGEIIETELLN